MKIGRFVVLFLLFALVMSSCTKEKEDIEPTYKSTILSDSCIMSFYKYPRNILLSDSFVDNRNNWNLSMDKNNGDPDCSDSINYVKINNGLYMKTRCSSGQGLATYPLTSAQGDYLAVEVKFLSFYLKMGNIQYWPEAKGLIFGYKGSFISIGEFYLYDFFSINFTGRVLHLLIDTKANRSFSYIDSIRPNYYPPAIIDENISGIHRFYTDSSATPEVKFWCESGESDLNWSGWADSLQVEYITIYEPVFPCK